MLYIVDSQWTVDWCAIEIPQVGMSQERDSNLLLFLKIEGLSSSPFLSLSLSSKLTENGVYYSRKVRSTGVIAKQQSKSFIFLFQVGPTFMWVRSFNLKCTKRADNSKHLFILTFLMQMAYPCEKLNKRLSKLVQ